MEFAMIYRLDLEGSPPPDFGLHLQESLHRGFQIRHLAKSMYSIAHSLANRRVCLSDAE